MEYGDLQYDLDRCRDLLEEERFEEAMDLATDLYERSALDPEVVGVFADAALAVREPARAIRACQKLLRSGIRDLEILEWLARAQWDLGLTEACRRTCRRLLAREGDNYIGLDYGLATVLELGDFEEARDILDLAIEHSGDDPHLSYQTAVARMMRGETEWALGRFEAFLEHDPEEAGTYINLMRIHHLATRYRDARSVYRRAMARGLDHEDLHFNMGLALKAEERDREALPYFVSAIRAAEEKDVELPDAYFHLGQILRSEGHPLLALHMLERELRVDDTHPAVHAEMAWSAEDLERYEDAVRMIRAAVERAPDWGVYQHSLAELLLKADPASPEAEESARLAISLDPEHAAGWQVLGRLAAERGDVSSAEDCLRRAIECADATAEDQGWLGLLLFEASRPSEAKRYLERAARVYPFWQPIGDALGRIRGGPLPRRYEIRISGAYGAGRRWYRVVQVVAEDEEGAKDAVVGTGRARDRGAGEVDEVRTLGFEVDHPPGIVWDSGRTSRRYPEAPADD